VNGEGVALRAYASAGYQLADYFSSGLPICSLESHWHSNKPCFFHHKIRAFCEKKHELVVKVDNWDIADEKMKC
jgi:hypothetical protein